MVPYGFGFDEAAGEAEAAGALDTGGAVGATFRVGETPAPESGAGEELGEGRAAVDAGEVCGAACDFISSRRRALSPPVLLWA